MNWKRKRIVLGSVGLFTLMTFLAGCGTHIHTVGTGGRGQTPVEARQWYAIWGLVPINELDTEKMAGEAKDYTIQTQTAPLDVLINIFTQFVTINSRTVTVTK